MLTLDFPEVTEDFLNRMVGLSQNRSVSLLTG
jgi:hypothetical protein